MFRLLVSVVAIFAAGPALALSCMPNNLAMMFNDKAASEKQYLIGLGEFRPPQNLPSPAYDKNRNGISATATFSFAGQFLNGQRLGEARTTNVEVTAGCSASWCGSFSISGEKVLTFIERRPDSSYALYSGACGAPMQRNPSSDQVKAIQQCIRDGECGNKQFEIFGGR